LVRRNTAYLTLSAGKEAAALATKPCKVTRRACETMQSGPLSITELFHPTRSSRSRRPAGLSVAYCQLNPHATYHPSIHPKLQETYFILGGTGTLALRTGEDAKKYDVQKQGVIGIPAGTKQLLHAGEAGIQYLAICTPPWQAE
jgi:mannose-6-phosphate isomerase-like protein (cupin superfamily)